MYTLATDGFAVRDPGTQVASREVVVLLIGVVMHSVEFEVLAVASLQARKLESADFFYSVMR